MNSNNTFEQLLYQHAKPVKRINRIRKPYRLTEGDAFVDDGVDAYKAVNRLIAAMDSDIRTEVLTELDDIDPDSLSADEIAELLTILQDAAVDAPSTADTLVQQDFDELVDNGHATALRERPLARMATANMIRVKHKMGLNAIPKSKLKATRIRNRLKNLKRRINAKKYYRQNKTVLLRHNKSYRQAIATGKHRPGIRPIV